MSKRQIRICLGSSCFSRGNNTNLGAIKKYLSENNLEAEIDFCGHLCEELCSKGPIIRIDRVCTKSYKKNSHATKTHLYRTGQLSGLL